MDVHNHYTLKLEKQGHNTHPRDNLFNLVNLIYNIIYKLILQTYSKISKISLSDLIPLYILKS